MGTDLILVAIDAQDVQNLAVNALRGAGYSVVEAAEWETSAAAARNVPGLVVIDSPSPGTLRSEFLERLRRARPDLKTLYLVGRHSAPGDADAHLHKPFFLDELFEAVACVLFGRWRCPTCLRQAGAGK
jgi:CheY-like chemotaxis protein